jgi:hypothetical protein
VCVAWTTDFACSGCRTNGEPRAYVTTVDVSRCRCRERRNRTQMRLWRKAIGRPLPSILPTEVPDASGTARTGLRLGPRLAPAHRELISLSLDAPACGYSVRRSGSEGRRKRSQRDRDGKVGTVADASYSVLPWTSPFGPAYSGSRTVPAVLVDARALPARPLRPPWFGGGFCVPTFS